MNHILKPMQKKADPCKANSIYPRQTPRTNISSDANSEVTFLAQRPQAE